MLRIRPGEAGSSAPRARAPRPAAGCHPQSLSNPACSRRLAPAESGCVVTARPLRPSPVPCRTSPTTGEEEVGEMDRGGGERKQAKKKKKVGGNQHLLTPPRPHTPYPPKRCGSAPQTPGISGGTTPSPITPHPATEGDTGVGRPDPARRVCGGAALGRAGKTAALPCPPPRQPLPPRAAVAEAPPLYNRGKGRLAIALGTLRAQPQALDIPPNCPGDGLLPPHRVHLRGRVN